MVDIGSNESLKKALQPFFYGCFFLFFFASILRHNGTVLIAFVKEADRVFFPNLKC